MLVCDPYNRSRIHLCYLFSILPSPPASPQLLHSFHLLPVVAHIRFKHWCFPTKAQTDQPSPTVHKGNYHTLLCTTIALSSLHWLIHPSRKTCIKTLLSPGTQMVKLSSSSSPNSWVTGRHLANTKDFFSPSMWILELILFLIPWIVCLNIFVLALIYKQKEPQNIVVS